MTPGDGFWIYHDEDEEGNPLVAPGEEKFFLEARPGDHLLCPFQCELCSFYKLKGHTPRTKDPSDALLLKYLRQANIDAFWCRRPGTVSGYVRLIAEQIDAGKVFGIEMMDRPGPFPRDYDFGIRAAIGVLWKSEKDGRHEVKQKYSRVRKVRTVHTHLYNVTAKGLQANIVLKGHGADKTTWVGTTAPSESEWLRMFMQGYHARVGERRKQDMAISIDQMVAIQSLIEERWREAERLGDAEQKRKVAEIGTFFLAGYCGSLRGFEVPKIVLSELKNQMQLAPVRNQPAHIGLPLRGRFKARGNAKAKVLVMIVPETASGLKPSLWLQRLVGVLQDLEIETGWLFQDEEGTQRPLSFFEEEFYSVLFALRDKDPTLFEPSCDIFEDYQLARSLRRGATTRATEAGVSRPDIDWMNRWNTGGKEIISSPMHVVYAERKQLIDTYLRFSRAL